MVYYHRISIWAHKAISTCAIYYHPLNNSKKTNPLKTIPSVCFIDIIIPMSVIIYTIIYMPTLHYNQLLCISFRRCIQIKRDSVHKSLHTVSAAQRKLLFLKKTVPAHLSQDFSTPFWAQQTLLAFCSHFTSNPHTLGHKETDYVINRGDRGGRQSSDLPANHREYQVNALF